MSLQINGRPKSGFPNLTTLAELIMAEYPAAKWVVSDLVESGAVTMLSAMWGQRKSWVCLHAAICVASGTPVFGHFETEQSGVLVVNEEDTARQIQERMKILDPPSQDLPIYFLIGQGFRLTDDNVTWLMAGCEKEGIGLIIFDSLRAIHGADENDSSAMQAVMNRLKRLADSGLSVLVTHHSRKPSANRQGNDSNGEETRGSGAINAAVHGHLAIETSADDGGEERVIVRQPKNKSAEKLKPFRVRVVKPAEGCLSLVYDGAHSAENSATKAADVIMTALKVSGRWMSVKELVGLQLAKERATRDALGVLEANGQIEATTRKDTPEIGGEGALNERFYTVKRQAAF